MIRKHAALAVAIEQVADQVGLQADRDAAVIKAGRALRDSQAALYSAGYVYGRIVRDEIEATAEGIAANEAFVTACRIYQARQAEARDALADWQPQR